MKTPNNPDEIEDRNRIMVAVLLSLLIFLGWQFFYEQPQAEKLAKQRQAQEQAQQKKADGPASAAVPAQGRTRDAVLADTPRVPVKGAKVSGSVPLKGLRLDDLFLNDHYVALDSKAQVPLFSPSGAAHAFYAESGWLAGAANVAVPSENTVWTPASGSPRTLESGGAPLRLVWDNGAGLSFEREIALDEGYLFTVTQRVVNRTGAPVTLSPYHLTARNGKPPDFSGFYVLHEGPVGFLGGKLADPSYADLADGEKTEAKDVSGWLGITDKYWMATILPDPAQKFDARVVGSVDAGVEHYQADIVEPAVTVAPGATAENVTRFYAGIKTMDALKAYEEKYGYQRLDLGIDFGMWYFITKPFYWIFHILVKLTGGVGLGILAMTVVVRLAMFPLTNKSYVSMAKMKKLQPLMKELQEKHKDDKAALQMALFELYKTENTNPFSGCWPMLVQIPVFFSLYKVILISVELRHAPFWGWIRDLSAPDPTSLFNLFGLIPWQPPQALMIGVWPILFCLSMIVQKRLSPPMPDPVQEKMQTYFPYFITFMMAHFSVGLVIYWTWSNVLAIFQQYYIINKMGDEKISLIHGHHARRKPKAAKDKKRGK